MHPLIKKIFVPHKGNNYHPHFWRGPSLALLVLIIVGVFGAERLGMWALPRLDLTAAILPSVLVDMANGDRKDNGLQTLRLNSTLEAAAKLKANDMINKGYFAHISPDGVKPWHWFNQVGYNFVYAGENLAIDFSDSSDVNRAWMNSPLHRANILNEHFTEIGIAMASGMFQGRQTTFVVQLFGQPVPPDNASVAKPVAVATPAVKPAVKPVATVPAPKKPVTIETIADTPTFTAVKNVQAAQAQAVAPSVAGEAVYSSWFAKILLSPRKTLAYIYFGLGLLIALALFLLVGIEVGKHHPKHIVYGLLLLALIIALFYLSRNVIFTEVLVL